jgi:predicted dehydrogenase
MASPIGIGILGCGAVSRAHLEAIVNVPELRLVSACSRSIESAERVARDYGVRAYTDLEEFFNAPGLDAVTICTPSGTHAELGAAAALVGKHVVVEKPIDVSLERADALIEACDRADRRLAVSLQSRHLDAPRALKDAVDSGRLGRMVMASAYVKWFRSDEYYASGAWRGTLDLDGGGALINQAIHTLDLLRWIGGPLREVAAFTDRLVHPQIEGEDTLVASLRFQSGACGVLEAATSVWPGFRRRIELTGTEGTVILDGDDITVWELRDGSRSPVAAAGDISNGSSNPMAISSEGHRRVMADFACAVLEGRAPHVDGRAGRESLEVVQAVYRSAREGRPVAL